MASSRATYSASEDGATYSNDTGARGNAIRHASATVPARALAGIGGRGRMARTGRISPPGNTHNAWRAPCIAGYICGYMAGMGGGVYT